jgi:hypothetical protein
MVVGYEGLRGISILVQYLLDVPSGPLGAILFRKRSALPNVRPSDVSFAREKYFFGIVVGEDYFFLAFSISARILGAASCSNWRVAAF